MADRQDIDALMVGALYGELSAAERTRLDSHLSSHPEDRAAMDGLEAARATVRRGMTEMAPMEPPQAVSAILLQEAARRRAPTVTATEPAEREGVWERFVAWFRPLAGHPALAAAAALILVVGTASALWMRNKGKVAEPTRSTMSAREELAPTAADQAPGYAAADKDLGASADTAAAGAATGSGSAFEVDSLDPNATPNELAKQDNPGDGANAGRGKSAGAGSAPRVRKPTTADGIVVGGKENTPEIKNLEDEEQQLAQESGDDATADGDKTTATGKGATAPRVAPQPEPALDDPQLEEWAKKQHQKLVKLVKDGKCPDAGRVGADLKATAPDYYAANVANDRDVRQCKAYIEKSAKKKAEKDYKSRSQGNAYDEADETTE